MAEVLKEKSLRTEEVKELRGQHGSSVIYWVVTSPRMVPDGEIVNRVLQSLVTEKE